MSAAPQWVVDTRRTPIIVFHAVGGEEGAVPDFESFLRVAEEQLQRRERLVVILDLTRAKPDAQRRKRLAVWSKKNMPSLERYVVALGLVAPTAFHRGLVTAATWLMRPRMPMDVFATLPQAEAWCLEEARRANLK